MIKFRTHLCSPRWARISRSESSQFCHRRVVSRNIPRIAPFEETNIHFSLAVSRLSGRRTRSRSPWSKNVGERTRRRVSFTRICRRGSDSSLPLSLPLPTGSSAHGSLSRFPSKFSWGEEGKLSRLGANERELSSPESEPWDVPEDVRQAAARYPRR